jgi:hypothetical protein
VYPGDHVGLDGDGRASTLAPTLIGVIDPFLKDVRLLSGMRVWMFLYPRFNEPASSRLVAPLYPG